MGFQKLTCKIELDGRAKELFIISTHKDLFQVGRLQMRMKNFSAIFKRCMEQVLNDINYRLSEHDIMVYSYSDCQLKKRLSQVNDHSKEYSVTVNLTKCVSSSASFQFLGFIFGESGIRPDPALTSKTAEVETPSSSRESAGFLGLATYYGRFIPEFADLRAPLHEAEGSKIHWFEEWEKNF